MKLARRVLPVVVVFLVPSAALACLWDYDTLRQERSRFPDTLELITGKFLRHSPEFYEWRIADRKRKLEADPYNLSYYDDLAVAYDKTGRHDEAIKTILAKDRLKPGLYETEANLGTFLIHSGKLKEGLVHIDNAIRINPDAHFGREKYQKALVEYVLKRGGAKTLPLMGPPPEESYTEPRTGFAFSLRSDALQPLAADERAAAVKGILGIMRFGNYDSPIVLEALGSVLADGVGYVPEQDAKRMAARAYLKASYEVKDEAAKAAYRKLAESSLNLQTRAPLARVEQDFQRELADAREWYERLRQDELSWIRDGKDPEAEFDKLYAADPQPLDTDDGRWYHNPNNTIPVVLAVAAALFVAASALVTWFIWRLLTRRRRAAQRANA
jgi:hypothetical protein